RLPRRPRDGRCLSPRALGSARAHRRGGGVPPQSAGARPCGEVAAAGGAPRRYAMLGPGITGARWSPRRGGDRLPRRPRPRRSARRLACRPGQRERSPMSNRILCVDDEPNILAGFKRALHRRYALEVAVGPKAGLEALAKDPYAVVVADL